MSTDAMTHKPQGGGSRRFVAGAVCPRCKAMDRLVISQSEDGALLECVSCGFQDLRTESDQAPMEPGTRLGRPLSVPAVSDDPEAVVPVRILDE